MAPYDRPVRWVDLLASPEMHLRHPAEVEGEAELPGTRGDDEGAGTGFDCMFPDAYVERWVRVTAPGRAVLAWYGAELARLGWHVRFDQRRDRTPSVGWTREPDEHIGVTCFGPIVRVHYRVDGCWPDGSTEPRPQ